MKYRGSKLYNQFSITRKYYKEENIKMFNESMLLCVEQMKIINKQNTLLLGLMKIKFSLLFKKEIVKNINYNLGFIIKENELLNKIKPYIESTHNKGNDKLVKTYYILIDIYELHTIRKDNIIKLVKELKYEHDNSFDEKIKTFTKRIDAL